MNPKLSLEILSLVFSDKKICYPWDIHDVYARVFPNKPFPTRTCAEMFSNHGRNIQDIEKARTELWEAAINYLTEKISS
jgi:hypothetical protein